MTMMILLMEMITMVTPYLIFDVEVGPGLTENLDDAREAVPGGDVQTGLFVLTIGYVMMAMVMIVLAMMVMVMIQRKR